jgi:hypothetical protein
MDKPQQHHSQLFTVRLWAEDLGDGLVEWRGKVQHVSSGEAHYFRDWHVLIALLQAMVSDDVTDRENDGPTDQG